MMNFLSYDTVNAQLLPPPVITVQTEGLGCTINLNNMPNNNGNYTLNLYRATTPGGEGSIPYLQNSNGYDSHVTANVTYYYQVSLVNSSGEGPKSNEASATPGLSTAVSAPFVRCVPGDGQVKLALIPDSSGGQSATSYNIYRQVDSGETTLYVTGFTGSSFTDTGLDTSLDYTYYIRGANKNGESLHYNADGSAEPITTSTTPNDPTPIIYNGQPVHLSASVAGFYYPNFPFDCKIYDTTQQFAAVLPRQFLTLGGAGSKGATTVNFTWDGTLNANIGVGKAPNGVYLFEVGAAGSPDKLQHAIQSSAPGLPSTAPLVSDDGTTATYAVSYSLLNIDYLGGDLHNGYARGFITVYDPNQKIVGTYNFSATDLQIGAHTVNVAIPSPTVEGTYTFLINAEDNGYGGLVPQSWCLQDNSRHYSGAISMSTTTAGHFSWCSPKYHVQLRTLLPANDAPYNAEAYAPKRWAKLAPAQSTRSAVNGSLFNDSGDYSSGTGYNVILQDEQNSSLFYKVETVKAFGEIGSNGNWSTQQLPCPRERDCFGMPADLATAGNGSGFIAEGMVPYFIGSKKYFSVSPKVKKSQYGFSGVGILVKNGQGVKSGNAWKWWPGKTATSRTVLAWTNHNDFFLIALSSKTWESAVDWLVDTSGTGLFADSSTDPNMHYLHSQHMQNGLIVSGAVMLDGGGSTQYSYYSNKTTPPTTDDGTQHGMPRYIPTFVGVSFP